MASHLSWLANLLFLLLILAQTPTNHTRPARASPASDVIAGNEFLKLFLKHDETQRELQSGEYDDIERELRAASAQDSSDSSSSTSRITTRERRVSNSKQFESTVDTNRQANGQELSNKGAATHSAQQKSHSKQQNEATMKVPATTTGKGPAEKVKRVVKRVTSGSKIVFLEEYDDNDAIVDSEARDIDLKKENTHTNGNQAAKESAPKQSAEQQQARMQNKSNPSDEIKVIAVSVSSSSKRGGYVRKVSQYSNKADITMSKQGNKLTSSHTSEQQSDGSASAMKLTLTTTPPTARMTASDTTTLDDFVNRSHKSEFSIEEAEPLTMLPQQQRTATNPHAARANIPRSLHTPHAVSGRAMKTSSNTNLDEGDSANSASSNIRNVLAAPLLQAASTRSAINVTSARINHQHKSDAAAHAGTHMGAADDAIMLDTSAVEVTAAAITDVEDKLLPFQTVIYHNTKEGHGPQSRSISYSSLSQNVEDLQKWRQTGILAEAQRNVSESLKPISRAQLPHDSEPAKFYSVPSKMYSEPAKFYSEPSKVYGEPAKVYGEPEKFYSEPAKVYGQPSKFYSEPSKVYSQPAKVYSEPSKTYWSPSTSTTSTSTTSTTTAKIPTHTTTTTMRPVGGFMPSRRPAIVSRIAFGEAQTSTNAPRVHEKHASATMSVITKQQQQPQHNVPHTRFPSHPYNTNSQSLNSNGGSSLAHSQSHSSFTPSQPSQSKSQSHSAQSQPRRVLFNLDKLPYDLLNAPVQSSQHLLDPDFSHSPPAAVTYSSPRQRLCLESAFSVSQHQQQQQHQHSSLSDQHSNQNAKGLPNRDLVKCVSIYNQPPAAPSTATTESGHNDNNGSDDDVDNNDDLYKPTPEQNYEIEESVSVMTNGRAHGVQDNSAATTTSKPYALRTTKYPSRGGINHEQHQQQEQQQFYHGNTNTNVNAANNKYDDNVASFGGDSGGLDVSDVEAGVDDDEGIGADGNKPANDDEDAKVAYVVEGRNYRKYRVEEKTDDGFIVGEYGVVDHNDGNLRGVRYTADSTINRSLIQKALLAFLKLK